MADKPNLPANRSPSSQIEAFLSRAAKTPTLAQVKGRLIFAVDATMSRQPTWDRATEIQIALIKAGYMNGEPTGVWNAESNAAMQKLQGDNGWQTKITPDSRALIKLGLGPQTASTSPTGGGSN